MRISDWSSDVCSSDLTLHLWGHAVQKLFANTRGTGMTSRFDAVYRRSLDDPEGFWGEAAEAVRWYRKWDRVLDADNMPFCRWFVCAETKSFLNAVHHHESGKASGRERVYQNGEHQ